MTSARRFVGHSVPRVEDPRLLTGHGCYVDEVSEPGMVQAAFVRSDVARALVRRLDTEAARAGEGVVAVLTAADISPLVRHDTWGAAAMSDASPRPLRFPADDDDALAPLGVVLTCQPLTPSVLLEAIMTARAVS